MIIGLIGSFSSDFDSLRYLFPLILEILNTSEHEIISFPSDYRNIPPEEKMRFTVQMLDRADVLFGLLDTDLLETRSRHRRQPRYFILALGIFPRGAIVFEHAYNLLTTHDAIICNSSADIILVGRFFPNLPTVLLPFPCARSFFRKRTQTRDARNALGLSESRPVILYTGRIILEKNIHNLLKLFCMVRIEVPDTLLILAGNAQNTPFHDWNISPKDYNATLRRLARELGVEQSTIFAGPVSTGELDLLYSAADLFVSMSLNHDENFGLSVVEAMASSLPVIVPAWGGFRDTVIDGKTGFQVPVFASARSPVLDWPFALKAITHLVTNPEQTRVMGRYAEAHAKAEFQEEHFASRLLRLFQNASRCNVREPIVASEFSRSVWSERFTGVCCSTERGMLLYKSVISSYAGTPQTSSAPDFVTLSSPCRIDNSILEVEHALGITRFRIPEDLLSDVASILCRLDDACGAVYAGWAEIDGEGFRAAIKWLNNTGALLFGSWDSLPLVSSLAWSIARRPLLNPEDFTSPIEILKASFQEA